MGIGSRDYTGVRSAGISELWISKMPWNQREWELEWILAGLHRARYDIDNLERMVMELKARQEVEDGDRVDTESSSKLD